MTHQIRLSVVVVALGTFPNILSGRNVHQVNARCRSYNGPFSWSILVRLGPPPVLWPLLKERNVFEELRGGTRSGAHLPSPWCQEMQARKLSFPGFLVYPLIESVVSQTIAATPPLLSIKMAYRKPRTGLGGGIAE